jgi:integrase
VLDVRDAATGKRRRRWHSFRGTCARLISDIQGDRYQEPDKTTLAVFLERWLEYAKSRVAPTTFERYAILIRKNIIPALGATVLTNLRPDQIAAGFAAARRRDGKGALSLRTVHHMHTVLKSALKQAVRWGALNRNPCEAVDPPRVERQHLPTYDVETTVGMLDLARSRRIFIPALLASMCGLRRGEVAALRWRNVDLETSQAAILESLEQTNDGKIRFKPPKSGKSRTIALRAFVVEELKAWRLRQAQELLQLGIRQTSGTLICAREDAQPLQPRSLTHSWDQFVRDKALPRIRFHDLRHAHATHLLASGVHPKIASERLGHSNIGITLDLYSHVIPGMQEDAVARVDEAVRQALQKRAAKTNSVAKR